MDNLKIYVESGLVHIVPDSEALDGLNTSLPTRTVGVRTFPVDGELTASVVNTDKIKVVDSAGNTVFTNVPANQIYNKAGSSPITSGTASDVANELNSVRFFGEPRLDSRIATEAGKVIVLENALKTSTGDRGVFVDDGKGTSQSHVAVTTDTSTLQAGPTTKVSLTDISTGQGSVSIAVRAGANTQQTSVTAITVSGDSNFNNALVTFNEPVTFSSSVSGIDTGDLGNVITGTPSDGDVLTWNNANQYYEPAAPTTGSGGGMSDLVDDTSPQLGGNLDVNGREIVSTSNGDIELRPNGSGKTKVYTELYAGGGIEHDASNLSVAGQTGAGAEITYLGATQTSVTRGKVYYWSGTAWTLATPTALAAQTSLLGIAMGTSATSGFLLRGFVNPNGSQTFTAGGLVFIASNSAATNSAPSSGYQRVIGHGITTTIMFFNPSLEYLKLT